MARPTEFSEQNLLLGPAEGTEEYVQPLPVFSNGQTCTSCWELTDEEIAEITRTRRVWVTVMAGRTQPPILIQTDFPMHMATPIIVAAPSWEIAEHHLLESGARQVSPSDFALLSGRYARVITLREALANLPSGMDVMNLGLLTDEEMAARGWRAV